MASKTQIAEFISVLSENFKGSPSEALARIIGEKLKHFSDEQLYSGLDRLLCSRKYSGFPTLAEILEAIQGNSQDLLVIEAVEAFELVCNLPHFNGVPDKRELDKLSPVARYVLRMMGGNTNSWTVSNLDFKRREFIDSYTRVAVVAQDKLAELGYEPTRKPLKLLSGGRE